MIVFTKMQGIGNDFIVIENLKNEIIYSYQKLSKYLCNRNFGIGADGVLYIEKSEIADFKMRIFNSDGTEAEMCGNGIRCFAKYLYENKILEKTEMNIETLAGVKKIKLILEGKKVSLVQVNMGKPCFEYDKIPVFYKENEEGVKIDNKLVYPISMGNPHAVCFVNSVENINIEKEGSLIEKYKYFPNKTNVEFVEIIGRNKIKVRVWERGVGETLACGTGACAAAVISNIKKNLEDKIEVKLKGGILKIEYDKKSELVYLKGEAEKVFVGKIDI